MKSLKILKGKKSRKSQKNRQLWIEEKNKISNNDLQNPAQKSTQNLKWEQSKKFLLHWWHPSSILYIGSETSILCVVSSVYNDTYHNATYWWSIKHPGLWQFTLNTPRSCFMICVNCSKPGYTSITCSITENFP